VVDEVGACSEGEGFGFEELFGGRQGDAAGGDHVDLWERALECGEVFGSAHGACRENFDDVGSGLPCSDDLGWGERAGKNGDGVAVAHLDGREVQCWADYEFGSFEDAHAGGLGVENGAGADEDVGALFAEPADDLDGTGDGHGDLEDGDAAVGYGSGYGEGFVYGVGAQDGDEADLLERLEDFVFVHGTPIFVTACFAVRTRPKDASEENLTSADVLVAKLHLAAQNGLLRVTTERMAIRRVQPTALSLDAGAAAFHDALHFVEGRHGGIAGGGHGEGSVGAAAVHGPIGALVVKEAVDEARSEGVAAAYAVEYFEVGHRPGFVELTFVVADCSPVVHGSGFGVTQGCGHYLEVGEGGDGLLDHPAEAC
jgi:hypothetical protein